MLEMGGNIETSSWIRKNINMVRVLSVPASGWQSLLKTVSGKR